MSSLQRLLVVLVGIPLAFCGAAGQSASIGSTVILPGFRGVVRMDTVGTGEVVAASEPKVFAALSEAFDSLGIEQLVRDSSARVVGNLSVKVVRRFAGRPMSSWVDCGVGHTGPTANAYRIHLAILATVGPSQGGQSVLKTAVAAGAQALGGPLGDPIACQSTGALEQRLMEIVQHRVASP